MLGLRNRLTKKHLKIAALVIFILCLIVVILNSRYLVENPLKSTIKWDEPSYSVVRDDGVFAVIDSYGTRISIASDNNELIGMIGSNSIINKWPNKATSLAFSNDSIFVLDHTMSDNCTEITGDKIFEYSLDGKLIKEIYSTPVNSSISICNVYSKDGQCYISAIDRKEHDEAVLARISDGAIEEIHRLSAENLDIYTVTYNVATDASAIITHNGKIYLNYGEDTYEYNPSSSGYNLTEAVCTDDGTVVCIDSTRDEILRFTSDKKYEKICKGSASHVTNNNAYLVFNDPVNSIITITDQNDDTLKDITNVKHSLKFRLNGLITFICLTLAVCYVAFHIIKFILNLIAASKRKNVKTFRRNNESENRTVAGIVNKMAPALIMCFIVASFVFSIFYWKTAKSKAYDDLIDIAASAIFISKNNVGEKLSNIISETDYDSSYYRDVVDVYDSLCGKYTQKIGFDYGYSIYKYIDDSDDVMVIKDKFSELRIGTILTREEQEAYKIDENLDIAYAGEVQRVLYKFDNGTKLMCITLPIYDSQDNIIGAAEISQNYSAIESEILIQIVDVLAEILTLIAGFSLILAEIQLAKEFVDIQLEIVESGDRNHTLAEGGHTLTVLSCIISTTSSIFLTLIAKDILDETGISETILIALPITIKAVVSNITKILSAAIPMRNAKRELNIGAILIVVGALIGIAAVRTSGFIILCICAAVLSMGATVCSYRSDIINKLDKTTDRYNKLESAKEIIAPPIAVAMGAFVRTYFGNTAVFVFLVIISVLLVVLKDLFVGIPMVMSEKKTRAEYLKETKELLRFSIRPKVILWLLVIAIPTLLLYESVSYIMPLMTQEMKSSDIVIASVTIIGEFLALFLAARINYAQKDYPKNISLMLNFVVFALSFFVFAKLETLQGFCIIVILIFILSGSMDDSKKSILKSEIKASGMTRVDGTVFSRFWESVLDNLTPLILSVMMIGGYRYFGLIFAGICVLCILIIAVVFRQKPAEDSIA